MLDNDPVCWNEVDAWIDAARVADVMFHNRLGLMGHYYGGMLDIYSDLTQHCATFGGHLEIWRSTSSRRSGATSRRSRSTPGSRTLPTSSTCSPTARPPSSSARRGRRSLSTRSSSGTISVRSRTTTWASAWPENEDAISSIILGNSLLTARGIPVAGEYEVKNVQAMKILDTLRRRRIFTEYYAMDYADDVVLMGHDGPGHLAIAEGKTKVRPLDVYHGKVGRGLSVEMSVKHGPVTLLSVVETGAGRLGLLMAEGESVPGPIMEIGNTNSRYSFPIGARRFVTEWNGHGPAHHCAVGTGHVSGRLAKLGKLLRIDVAHVC